MRYRYVKNVLKGVVHVQGNEEVLNIQMLAEAIEPRGKGTDQYLSMIQKREVLLYQLDITRKRQYTVKSLGSDIELGQLRLGV